MLQYYPSDKLIDTLQNTDAQIFDGVAVVQYWQLY